MKTPRIPPTTPPPTAFAWVSELRVPVEFAADVDCGKPAEEVDDEVVVTCQLMEKGRNDRSHYTILGNLEGCFLALPHNL